MKIRPGDIEVIDEASAEMFRRMTGQQRLARSQEMFRYMRDTLRRYLAQLHPEWNEQEIRAELLRRLHGPR